MWRWYPSPAGIDPKIEEPFAVGTCALPSSSEGPEAKDVHADTAANVTNTRMVRIKPRLTARRLVASEPCPPSSGFTSLSIRPEGMGQTSQRHIDQLR